MTEVTKETKKANRRTALILGTVALGFFFVGIYLMASKASVA